jgi:hypothetical protein
MKTASLVAGILLAASSAFAGPVAVSLDTSPLIGGTYYLSFQLNGDGPSTAVFSAFGFGSGGGIGATDSPVWSGAALGSLGAGSITLHDSTIHHIAVQLPFPAVCPRLAAAFSNRPHRHREHSHAGPGLVCNTRRGFRQSPHHRLTRWSFPGYGPYN